MNKEEIMTRLLDCGVFAVIRGETYEKGYALAKACAKGGIVGLEVTYTNPSATAIIEALSKEEGNWIVGAGTVLDPVTARLAILAGAKFIVSPGFSEEVAQLCNERGIPYLGGCVTPTEIMTAISYGCNIIKFFPCSNYGGLATMKALAAAFPAVTFLPTGGISDKNLAEYLAWEKIFAVGGSWMMKGTPEEVKEKCAEAVAIAKGEK